MDYAHRPTALPADVSTGTTSPASDAAPARPARRREAPLTVSWARHADEVREAQRLRHAVFAGEMGARLAVPPGTPEGLDVDRFDAHCEHLLVRANEPDGAPGRVVGTYRVLTPAGARLAGGLYSEGEFDLAPLAALRPAMVELGRSCTDPEHRSGGVILLLWASLGEFMQRNGLRWMIGCASVPMRDGGHGAAALWRTLRDAHLADPTYRVTPRLPLPVDELDDGRDAIAPPLIKGYLRCGAQLLGAPAWDPDFGTADLPMMLDLATLPASYRRHFIGA